MILSILKDLKTRQNTMLCHQRYGSFDVKSSISSVKYYDS